MDIWCDENNAEEQRTGSVKFANGTAEATFNVSQLPAMFRSSFREFDNSVMGALSKNGRYYAYLRVYNVGGDVFDDECFVIDFTTGDTTEIDLETPPEGNETYDSVGAISDDGRTLIIENKMGVVADIYIDGGRTPLSCQPGYSRPWPTGMSADGSVIVGSCSIDDAEFYKVAPCKWVNGEQTILDMPELNAGGLPLENGVYLRGCSSDGSVIYGSEWDSFGLVYYKDDRMFNIGVDNSEAVNTGTGIEVVTNPYLEASYNNVSHNGKWIVCNYRLDGVVYPFRVDTETGSFEYLESARDCGTATVTDDGIVFGYSPATNAAYGVVIDFNAGTTETIDAWMERVHGITVSSDRWIDQVGDNGKSFAGKKISVTPLGLQSLWWYMVTD